MKSFMKRLPVSLLPVLLTVSVWSQEPSGSAPPPGSGYGIEPERFYPGSLVLGLLQAAEEEIDAAVKEAFAEGYKEGALAYAPEAARYQAQAEGLREEARRQAAESRRFSIQNKVFYGGGGALLGVIVTVACFFIGGALWK